MDQRAIVGPPRHAVAAGAATPIGLAGAVIWSTTENRLLLWNGATWQPAKNYLGSVVYTASTTLVASDADAFLGFDVPTPHTLTIPPNTFAVGQVINGVQLGLGATQFVAGADVTINSYLGLYTAGQYATWYLYQRSLNVWELRGDLKSSISSLLYALTNFTIYNCYLSSLGGGEAGVATGFGVFAMFRLGALGTTGRTIVGRSNNSNAGWMVYIGTTNLLRFYVASGAGAFVSSPTYQLTTCDVGKVFCIAGVDSGSGVQAWVGKTWLGAETARTGFTAHAGSMSIGALEGNQPDAGADLGVIGALTWRGVPSGAAIQGLFDTARQTGDVPSSISVASVRGLKSFTSANYYSVAGGFVGVRTGFAVGVHVRWDAVPTSSNGRIMGKSDGSTKGWRIVGYNGNFYMDVFGDAGASGDKGTPNYPITTSDVGQPMFALFVHDGSFLRAYFAGLETGYREWGSGSAIVGYADPTGSAFYLGKDATGSDASGVTVFGAVMKNGVPTSQEMTVWFNACKAAGRIQPLLGEVTRYDVATDTATGSSTAPATLTDRAGGGNSLTKSGTPTVAEIGVTVTHRYSARDQLKSTAVPTTRLYGARGFTASNYLTVPTTAVPGSLSGFSVRVRMRHDATPSNNMTIFANAESLVAGKGFSFYYTAGMLRVYSYSSGTDVLYYSITSADYAAAYLVYTIVFTGSSWRFYQSDRLLLELAGTYAVPAGTSSIGIFYPTLVNPCTAFSVFEVAYGTGVPSQSDLLTAFMADTLVIPGQTDHRWVLGDGISVPASIADLGTGTPAAVTRVGTLELAAAPMLMRPPAQVEDTLTRSPLDAMARQSGIGVMTTDLSRDGRRTLGIQGCVAANLLQTVAGGGIPGVVDGWWVECLIHKRYLVGDQIVFSSYNGSSGWAINARTDFTYFYAQSSGGLVTMTGAAMSDGVHHVALVYTGATLIGYVDGVQIASAAQTTYVPSTAATTFGAHATGASPATSQGIYGGSGGHFKPTAAEIAAAAFSALLNLRPMGIPGKTSHLWDFTTDVLAAGETIPAKVIDRIGSDDLTRYGGNRVATAIAPMYGVGYPSTSGYFGLSSGGPVGNGTNGIGVAIVFRLERLPTSTGVLVDRFPTAGTTGFSVVLDSSSYCYFAVRDTTGAQVNSSMVLFSAADVGIPIIVFFQVQPGLLQGWICRGGVTTKLTDVVMSNLYAPPSTSVGLGVGARIADGSANYPASGVSIFDVEVVTQWLTAGDVTTLMESTQTSWKLPTLVGKTGWRPDFQAALATGVMPTLQINDTAGSAPLLRSGMPQLARMAGVQGMADWSVSSNYQTRPGLGLCGHAAGFWVSIVFRVPGPSSAMRMLVETFNGVNGYFLRLDGSNNIAASITLGTQSMTGLYGTIVVATLVYTGTVGRLYVNGIKKGSDYTYTYPVATGQMVLGYDYPSASQVAGDIEIFGVVGGNGASTVPTDAEMWSHYLGCTFARAPIAISGKTTHLYDITQDIAAAGTTNLPTVLRERVSGVEHMARVGAPLQVAQRTERTYSYDTSPILYGLANHSDNDYYDTQDGEAGDLMGWWGYVAFVVTSQAVSSATRALIGKLTATTGWDIRVTGTNSVVQVGWQDSTPAYAYVGAAALGAADVGKVQVYGWTWDAPSGMVRVYHKRVLSTSASRTGYTPGTGRFILGTGYTAGYAATSGLSILGFALGRGTPTLGEWHYVYDVVVAKETMVAIPGRTTMMVDVSSDIRENNGVLPGMLRDRVGTSHLARTGQPTVTPHYARVYGW